MVVHETLDQYLISVKVKRKFINGLRRYESLKNFNQENPKFQHKISKFMTLTSRPPRGKGVVLRKILDHYLSSLKV